MDADFMTMPREDRLQHLRMKHHACRRNEERRRHLLPIEEQYAS